MTGSYSYVASCGLFCCAPDMKAAVAASCCQSKATTLSAGHRPLSRPSRLPGVRMGEGRPTLSSRTCCLTGEGAAEGWGPLAAIWPCTGAVVAKAEVDPQSKQFHAYVLTSCPHVGVLRPTRCALPAHRRGLLLQDLQACWRTSGSLRHCSAACVHLVARHMQSAAPVLSAPQKSSTPPNSGILQHHLAACSGRLQLFSHCFQATCTLSCAGQGSGQGGTHSLAPARVQQQAQFVSDRLRQELQTRSYLIQAQVGSASIKKRTTL